MKKQKICIIGSGLTGLVTAIVLSKLNVDIDLITQEVKQSLKSNRTTAISQNSLNYLKKHHLFKFVKKEFWPCFDMKLYTENENEKGKFNEIFNFNEYKKKKIFLYMVNNYKLIKHLVKNIKKNKSIKFKNNIKIDAITPNGFLQSLKSKNNNNSKYNLIIICAGHKSNITKNFFNTKSIEHSYEEVAITTILKHAYVKNNTAKQIFLNNSIMALLPLSNSTSSIVWSVKKDFIFKNKKNIDFYIKNEIKFYTYEFLGKIQFLSGLEFRDLNLLIQKQYYKDRVLLFGDALHVVHPLAGQGFNMILRDLDSLEKILGDKINLGLDIGSVETLSELSNEIKPRNLIYSLGIDFIKNGFSIQKKPLKKIRNKIINNLNENNLAKNFFFNIADVGLKF